MSSTIWLDGRTAGVSAAFAQNLRYLLENVNIERKPLAFACIGSAKVMGDNLGPLIGTILSRYPCPRIYGTMQAPLNALTLPGYLPFLERIKKEHCLIAVDASLGHRPQTGCITMTDDCLYPGAGVSRNLPAIGHLHITGVFDSLDSPQARQLLPVLCRSIGLGLLTFLDGI